MAVKRNYRINLRNYGNSPAIMVSQYDENYDLVFEVYDGVVPATGLNAYTVKLVGRQPGDDPALKYEFTGTVSGIANNILSFTIDTTMTGKAGKGTAEIVILDTTNDVKFASFNLPVYVEKAAVPDDAIDADVERAQEIADEVQDIVDTAAAEVKGEAESWAVGERDGEPVPSTDPTYHNNAKYYAEQAQDIADSIGIDATLSISGKAADAKKTGDEISSLKEDLNIVSGDINRIDNIIYEYAERTATTTASSWRLNDNGLCDSSSGYKLVKYTVTAGDVIKVISDDRFQFQTVATVPSSGTSNRVGNTYGVGEFVVQVPETATYLIISTPTTSNAHVYTTTPKYDKEIDIISEDTANLLTYTGGTPNASSGYIYAVDFGENKTFSNGVIFSFDANNLIVSATNNAVVDLQENDGTHHYCTYVSLYDEYGNQFVNTKAQNGRFSTLGFSTYSKSITFRYCIVRTGAITSGSISHLMLTAGQSLHEYADSKTAIDYDARNLIRDDGADYLAQSVYKINGSTIKPVTLLHFSDIHGDTARLTDIMAFANDHDNITDILHTGDTVSGIYSDGLAWWDSVSGSQKILNVIGNHDAITSQTNPTIIDMDVLAETYIEPYVSNWDVTYTNGTTYYYKDYDNGVRLICLDCMHITDSTQLSWLQTVLDGALSASKHVVIGFHYYAYPHTVVDCEFSPKVDVASVQASIPNTVLDLVKAFQTGGGKFVCYLTGHNHYDMIVTPSDYPEQLVIGITCATNVYGQSKFGDQTRRGVRFANAFNLVTINPQTYTVSIRRIGADMDMLGRERKGFGWNYANHEKLF